jgi:hypothetical protein
MRETKPFRCQGTNENCMFCFGAGVVLANVPLIEQTLSAAGGVKTIPSLCVEKELGNQRSRVLQASERRRAANNRAMRVVQADRFTICEDCLVRVKRSRYNSHRARRCPGQSRTKKPKATKLHCMERSPGLSQVAEVKAAKAANQNKTSIFNGLFDKNLDVTGGYAHAFRENGRFGSHPSHDGFDDDSNP